MKKILIITAALTIIAAMLPFYCSCQKTEKPYRYVNPMGDEFPVVAWSEFMTDTHRTHDFFNQLHEDGINIVLGPFSKYADIIPTLEAAEGSGVKLILQNEHLYEPSNVERTVDAYKNYPSLLGYYLKDEPNAEEFSKLQEIKRNIMKYDSKHFFYLNLLPMWPGSTKYGAPTYADYLRESIDEIGLSYISYDCYPITYKDGVYSFRDDYYENLEVAREVTQQEGVALWTFILSCSHFSYPMPTRGEMLLQMNSGLAYGAQGIQYYKYGPPTASWGGAKDGSPLNAKGKRTKVWYTMKDINSILQARKNVWLGAKVEGVWHTGSKIPKGTTRLSGSDLPKGISHLTSEGEGVIVSKLKNGNSNYLMIVNRDFLNSQTVNVWHDATFKIVDKEGKSVANNARKVKIPAGDCVIYSY